MRRMRLNLVALAFVLFGMAMSTTSLQSQVLINLTNQIWRYDQSGVDPGAFWDVAFDDSAWLEGRGILAHEDSIGTVAVSNNIIPYTNTVLLQPTNTANAPNHTVDYFRTHFTFSGAGNPDTWVLTASNLIDDGYVMYLNGIEVSRYNMNAANELLAAAANPGGEGIYIVTNLCIPAGVLVVGDNVLAVRVHQNSGTSSDVVWGTVLHARPGSAPSVTSPTTTQNIALGQGRNTNLNVTVQLAPCGTLQWYFDPTGPAPAAPITGSNTTTLAIIDMEPSKAGTYFLRANNAAGTVDSPNFVVTFDADTTAPRVTSASASPTDLTLITVTYSENVLNANDYLYYFLEATDGSIPPAVSVASYGASSNVVALTIDPRDPAKTYILHIELHGITDFFGNPLADPTTARVTVPTVVQEGLNGYLGTQDTEVRRNLPDSAAGGTAAVVNTDLQDGTPAGPVHSLLRFDNLIGGGANQVPLGAIVNSAQLRIYTDDPTDATTPIRLVRMLVNWDESSTWNSMVNGIDETNGVETSATVDAIIDGAQDNSFDTMDVTATVQAWANGTVNHGWAFLPSGNNGWRWATSENATADNRPRLTVDFAVQTAPCHIQDEPDAVSVAEKQPFTLSVLASGSDLTYQWYFDPAGAPVSFSAIAGASSSSYTVNRAVPANAGSYYVVVQNNIPSSCTSATAIVTVAADTVPPHLTSALGNFNQTTISLTFDDTLDAATAGNPATYSVPGLTISGVGVNGSSVTLTSSAPRVVGNNYTLTITGLRDDAVARNLISPNPTVTNLYQQYIWVPFGSTWKFDTNGLDLGTAWSQVGYNDSAWPSGHDLLGFETNMVPYGALGLDTNNMTHWSLMRPDGTQNITYYLRKQANLPYNSPGATLQVRHVTDDGALYYLNGAEVFRYNMPTGAVTYLTGASSAPAEGVIRSSGQITNIPCGDITVAVELHNQSATSSDVLFGGELLVTVPSFSPCVGPKRLHIVNNGNGTVTLSWTPAGGTLQQSTDLTNWTPAANQNNPQTFAPTGVRFYRVP